MTEKGEELLLTFTLKDVVKGWLREVFRLNVADVNQGRRIASLADRQSGGKLIFFKIERDNNIIERWEREGE